MVSVAIHRSVAVLPCFPRGLGLFVCGRLCGCLAAGSFARGGLVFGLRLVAGCLGLALVFAWGAHRGGVWSLFFGAFLLVLAKFLFWQGVWALS